MIRASRFAVIGAGTMGAQLAALLAGLGFSVRLFDIVPEGAAPGERRRLAVEAIGRLRRLRPSPVFAPASLEAIAPANLEDDLGALAEADWVIEAVAERLEVKRQVWTALAPHVRPDAVLSTNTSGLGIGAIAAVLPPEARPRFLGTHFFNPPRYLRLLEVIPGPETDPDLLRDVEAFGRDRLGKGVVVCRDTPYFIGNRLGTYGLIAAVRAMEAHGLTVAEVDALTGPPMGRPRSATFRTLDLVGLDVFADVARNLAQAVPGEADSFALPPLVSELLRRGRLGDKAGGGFYRRQGRTILVVDPATFEYRPVEQRTFRSLEAASALPDLGGRLRALLAGDDPASRVAWEVSSALWCYAAERAEEIAGGSLEAIDRAMRWGFGWEVGPFAAWDRVGVAGTAERLRREGRPVPAPVEQLLAAGRTGWYDDAEPGGAPAAFWWPGRGTTQPATEPRSLTFAERRRAGGLVRSWPGASLVDLGEGVLGVELHSPKDALGPDAVGALAAGADEAARGWRALVVGSDRPNLAVGANLALILAAAQEEDWEGIDRVIGQLQEALLALRLLPVPVVAAVRGYALGGGFELALAAARIVAAAESYIGLVEAGVGLVPAGGGCKEMLRRALEGRQEATEGGLLPPSDPVPLVARIFAQVAQAKVATSAPEAVALGWLGPCDRVVANPDQVLWWAHREAVHLAEAGWTPPRPARLPALGADGRALLDLAVYNLRQARRASEHDAAVAGELAGVLCGGDAPAGTPLSERDVLALERAAFVRLTRSPKTQERMAHVLRGDRGFRN